ncbi:hypothetical protein AAT19DRAFT_16150 [Rhodotorula toruloides]|uniref:Uncharacterized protein n=1 Tax=Rhodotorula toruloides TaxID=5286 RepID=A0A2T0A5V7_RHOTO|nr:hypothetical protein AAT19DRAFT_16150 [Rhodotorula toruloides]
MVRAVCRHWGEQALMRSRSLAEYARSVYLTDGYKKDENGAEYYYKSFCYKDFKYSEHKEKSAPPAFPPPDTLPTTLTFATRSQPSATATPRRLSTAESVAPSATSTSSATAAPATPLRSRRARATPRPPRADSARTSTSPLTASLARPLVSACFPSWPVFVASACAAWTVALQ